MTDHHRYEELAVGHVLGGLDVVDQAEFRTHLLGCRDCRTRVAELRDIASDLEAAERQERAASRVKMEVARRQEDTDTPEEEEPRWGALSPRLAAVLALAVVVLVGLLLWNFHLRDVNRALLAATDARESVLMLLASGEPMPVEPGADGVLGLAAAADGQVALDLAGLPAPQPDQWVGVWFLDPAGEPTMYLPYAPRVIDEGVFAVLLEDRGASRILLTLERGSATGRTAPEGTTLATVDLGG